MNISLISEYKKPFVLQRIFQTFFGGILLLNQSSNGGEKNGTLAGANIIRNIFIYLFPSSVGITSSILIDVRLMDAYIGVLVSSIVAFFYTIIMNILPQIQPGSYKTSPIFAPESPGSIINDGQLKQRNYSILSNKNNSHPPLLLLVARSLMSSSLLGMMTHTFKLKQIKIHIHTGSFTALMIFILVWLTFTTVHYSLIVGPPPETTSYCMRFNNIDHFSRSIYLIILLIAINVINVGFLPFTVAICCQPFMWVIGIMPPIGALFYYLLERLNIVLLAGTPSCSIIQLMISTIFCLGTVSLGHFYLDGNQFILLNLFTAFFISNKWLFNWRQWWTYWTKMAVSAGAIIVLDLVPISIWIQEEMFKFLFAQILIVHLANHFRMVYILNAVKNPLQIFMSKKSLKRIHSSRWTIMILRIILHAALPMTCLALVVNKLPRAEITKRIANSIPEAFILNLLVFRLFRQSWQRPQSIAIEIIILELLNRLGFSHHPLYRWPCEAKYFLLDLIAIFFSEFFNKLYLVLVLLFSSVAIRKQKVRYSWTIFAINVILFPVNLAIIVISSLLFIPILPLFTLPIFLLSFPRPVKFWPTTPASTSADVPDTVYYQQLVPRLIESLHQKTLFWDFRRPGEFLLARFHDRLIWLQILEAGHNYVQVQAKGLELQETSCHTIEASTIDQLIEQSFQGSNIWCDSWINKYFFYAINPLMKVSTQTYSDSRGILTGIIDSPSTFESIKKCFCQVFVWILLNGRIRSIMEQKKFNEEEQKNFTVVKDSSIVTIGNQFTFDDLQPEPQWLNVSYQFSGNRTMTANTFLYSMEWFQKILQVLTYDRAKLDSNELLSLMVSYKQITTFCFSIIFPMNFASETSTAQTIYESFNGRLANDIIGEKKFNLISPDLYQVCVRSFRYATKIGFDQIIFGDETIIVEDLIGTLQEFDQDWLFCELNSDQWKKAVISEKPYLFSITKDIVKENYQSHLLTLKEMDVYVCSLNRAVIEAIWSSLSLELLYFTNDDEERYSIQAHPIILRNLTVQAADPPLGYPIFASSPILISHIQ